MSNTAKTQKNFEELAKKAPTQLHKDFAEWLFIQTGIKPDLKTVQLAVSFRMDFQASPENQKSLADRKAKAAAAKKASAERKKAKLQAELLKITGKQDAETIEKIKGKTVEEKVEEIVAPVEPGPIQKLTVLYGSGEPEIHKFGCADLKKYTRAKGFTKETELVRSHTELTESIYADQIGGGEATTQECYMGYDVKPCCPSLDS